MGSPIKKLDFRKFLPMQKNRAARFESGAPDLPATDNARAIARALHPRRQCLKVIDVIERAPDCKSFVLSPDPERGTSQLAYFSAGKYLTVYETVNGVKLTRAYSISSAPKASLGGIYEITVKRVEGGLLSGFILDTWQVGTPVTVSAPSGTFEYHPLRDAPTVVGVAGGSGITPFISLANAIADGDEDLDLILLYGSRNTENILFREELTELERRCPRVHVIHVLSDEQEENMPEGAESGFITAELIEKYAPADTPYSVFLCGPQQLYAFVDKELEKLSLEKKYVRHELFGEPHDPTGMEGYPANVSAEISVTVTVQDETRTVKGSSRDTVLQILEKNGIAAPARCRSGECGFCHSRLLSGSVYVPPALDRRRLADAQFGCFHPCCSFPLSDLVIEVPSAK